MSNFLSRTVTSAFVNFTEIAAAVDNTKLMLTERQRRMVRDALRASSERFRDLVAIHGYGADMDDEAAAPIKHQFQMTWSGIRRSAASLQRSPMTDTPDRDRGMDTRLKYDPFLDNKTGNRLAMAAADRLGTG